jgi:hypothetical protein
MLDYISLTEAVLDPVIKDFDTIEPKQDEHRSSIENELISLQTKLNYRIDVMRTTIPRIRC